MQALLIQLGDEGWRKKEGAKPCAPTGMGSCAVEGNGTVTDRSLQQTHFIDNARLDVMHVGVFEFGGVFEAETCKAIYADVGEPDERD